MQDRTFYVMSPALFHAPAPIPLRFLPALLVAVVLLVTSADLPAQARPSAAQATLDLARRRLRTPLLRADAERLLRRAHATASRDGERRVAAEAAWELGQVFARRYRTTWHRYVYTGSIFFDQFAARSRLHYVREFLEQHARPVPDAGRVERTEAEEWFRRALAADASHDGALAALLALLHDEHRHEEIVALAEPRLATGTRAATVWLAAGLAHWRLGDGGRADARFARALTLLPEDERRDIEHIGQLVTRSDSVRLAQLDDSTFAATTRAFWEAANPLLALPVNAARVEYLARIAVATLRYDDAETGVRGWRSDRGRIVLRYGEPPVTALFPVTDNPNARDAAGRIISVFFYPGTELAFVFAGPAAMNVAGFAGDYREFADVARADSPFRLDNVAAARQVDTLEVQLSRFMASSPAEWDVVVAGHLDPARWYRSADVTEGALHVTLWHGMPDRLRAVDSQVVAVRTTVEAARPIPTPARTWISTLRVRPGDHRLRLEALDPDVQSAAARAHVALPITVNAAAVTMSDLMLGSGGRNAATSGFTASRAAAGVAPLGRLVVHPRDTFALYWETYGLQPDSGSYHVRVKLTVTLVEIVRRGDAVSRWLANVADFVGLTPEGDDRLTLSYVRREPTNGRDRLPQVLRLGLGEAPTGRYRVQIEMTDLASGRTTTGVREFQVRPRTGDGS